MAFELVNTQALKDFADKGTQYVQDFKRIKQDFEQYNKDFLKEYEGLGAEKYKEVSELITEKVSDFEDVFKNICENLVNPTLKSFEKLDEYLNNTNKDMTAKENLCGDDKNCQT